MAEEKKLHWTQTPEGRERMSKVIRKAYRRKRKMATMPRAEHALRAAIATNGHPNSGARRTLRELIKRMEDRRDALVHTIETLREEMRRS